MNQIQQSLPLVSVIIPTRNRPDFLKAALKSVCAQTYKNIEIIVINDGGDDVSGIINGFRDKCRIEYTSLLTGKGPAASRNEGIRRARGKYIAYLDDDDIYYPNHLDTLVGILEKDNCSVVYADSCQAFQRPEGGRYKTYDKKLVYSEEFDRQRLLIMNYIRAENIVHRRDCIAEVGMFDESLGTHEDWDLWIRLSRKYEFRHIRTVTAEFRTRVKSEGITASNRPDFLRTMRILHSRYSDYATDPDIKRKQKYVEAELEKEIMLKAQFELQNGSYSVEKAKTGKLTFRIKAEDGNYKTLHSIYDPEAEAQTLVNSFDFDGKGMLVVLGLGLGYHVKELSLKYPQAEILVVEKYPAIRELAKEHGPEFDRRIKIVSGMLPDDAIKYITNHQLKKGFVPVSVFPLNSAVSAFPEYYRPILDSLKKTAAVKLWDRLRYAKFKEDNHKVLLIDSGYFLNREIEKALKELDHKVIKLPVDKNAGSEGLTARFIESIVELKPDFILTVNHIGFDEQGALTSFFESIEMPVASWYVDSPNLIVKAFDKNVSPFKTIFMWDKTYIKDMESMGFESVSYMPLGTDEGIFKPVKKHRNRLKKYICDVGFVGNSMVEPVEKWMSKTQHELHPMINDIAERMSCSETVESVADAMYESEKAVFNKMSDKEKMDFEAAVIWKATMHYRLNCIKALSEFDMTIHGDNGWKKLLGNSSVRLAPPLNYYKELPLFYNACRINFNATSVQMKEAVNQRVFDVPACGAFLVTDHKGAINDLFVEGEEIVTFKNAEELPELVKFYLNHHDRREAIAAKGRARVLKQHTYKHRLQSIIKVMGKRYKG